MNFYFCVSFVYIYNTLERLERMFVFVIEKKRRKEGGGGSRNFCFCIKSVTYAFFLLMAKAVVSVPFYILPVRTFLDFPI